MTRARRRWYQGLWEDFKSDTVLQVFTAAVVAVIGFAATLAKSIYNTSPILTIGLGISVLIVATAGVAIVRGIESWRAERSEREVHYAVLRELLELRDGCTRLLASLRPNDSFERYQAWTMSWTRINREVRYWAHDCDQIAADEAFLILCPTKRREAGPDLIASTPKLAIHTGMGPKEFSDMTNFLVNAEQGLTEAAKLYAEHNGLKFKA